MLARSRLALLGVLAVGAPLATASVASADPCVSSNPTGTAFADSPTDSEAGLAPEVTNETVTLDGSCSLTLAYNISNRPGGLISGDFVGWFIDSDGNPNTGEPSGFKGADYALGRDSSGVAILSHYNAATGQLDVVKQIPASGDSGVVVNLNDLSTTSGTTMTLAGAADWKGIYSTYYDWVPEPGQAPNPFTVVFSGLQPQVTPTTPVQQQPTQSPPSTTTTPHQGTTHTGASHRPHHKPKPKPKPHRRRHHRPARHRHAHHRPARHHARARVAKLAAALNHLAKG